MKRKYLILIFIFLVVYIINDYSLFITVEVLPDFKIVDEFDSTKEFSNTQKIKIREFIDGKTFTKHMNIYAEYRLSEDRFKYISLYNNNLRDNPMLVKNNFIFRKKSYHNTRIIISKTGLLGGSKIQLDGDYYKISSDEERRLLKILN